ncbi:hypothetical protein ACFYNV_29035 [Streptomyces albidoflavus]
MTIQTTRTTPATFQAGDRILCSDGVARTVRVMAPLVNGEPVRVVVEDGTEWAALNCRRANPEDLAAARLLMSASAARVRQADPDAPQWRAALADLTAAQDYLKAADPDPRFRAALAEGEVSAARTQAEIEKRKNAAAPAQDQEEQALRAEVAAHFVVLSHDGRANSFQAVHARGEDSPVAWTYRTGYGHAVRYGWVLAGGRLRTEHAVAIYRWQAEEDAASSILTLAARGEGDTPIVDALAHVSLGELQEALDRLQDCAARTRGTSPRHVLDQGVAAALKVLASAHFAEVPQTFDPAADEGAAGHDPTVTGLVVEPAAGGGVIAYWVERGRYVTPAGHPHTAQLRDIRHKLQAAGWETAPGTVRTVSAYRPTA